MPELPHPIGPRRMAAPLDALMTRVLEYDGYRTQQATRPQTPSFAMLDSPVGVAALEQPELLVDDIRAFARTLR